MNKKAILFTLLSLVSFLYAQTIEELYAAKDYQGLVWLEGKTNKATLSGEQSYMLAHAFFQTENDQKAIGYYTNAISKGFDSTYVYFQKAVAHRYLKQYTEAHQALDMVLSQKKSNAKYLNEKGLIYIAQKQYAKAMEIFESLQKASPPFVDAYYWSAYTHLQNNENAKALAALYKAKENTTPEHRYYLLILDNIGMLEYYIHKAYNKSLAAYKEAHRLAPTNQELKFLLIKGYNAIHDTTKADSLFKLVQNAYQNKELNKETMKTKNIIVADFEWKGQKVVIRKSLDSIKAKSDLAYKVFLLDKKGEGIERKFKVVQVSEQNPKLQLYEEDSYGKELVLSGTWYTPVSVTSLRKQMESILGTKK